MTADFDGPNVHFVSGKGGVGKTLLSGALAHLFSKKKQKTLWVTLAGRPPLDNRPRLIFEPNLWHLSITAEQAFWEYLGLKSRAFKKPARPLEHKLAKLFLTLIPGLSELLCLGKIWHMAQEDSPNYYPKIVVDMPSSGFVLRFLGIARTVEKAVHFGPVAKEAQAMGKFFQDPKKARLHIVTLLEDLAVNECIWLYQEIKKNNPIEVGSIWVNGMWEKLDLDFLDSIQFKEPTAPHARQEMETILRCGFLRKQLMLAQKNQLARLKKSLNMGLDAPIIQLPILLDEMTEEAKLRKLATFMEKIGQGQR